MSTTERIVIVYIVGVVVSWCGVAIYGQRMWRLKPVRFILTSLALALVWPAIFVAYGQAEVSGHNDEYR